MATGQREKKVKNRKPGLGYEYRVYTAKGRVEKHKETNKQAWKVGYVESQVSMATKKTMLRDSKPASPWGHIHPPRAVASPLCNSRRRRGLCLNKNNASGFVGTLEPAHANNTNSNVNINNNSNNKTPIRAMRKTDDDADD